MHRLCKNDVFNIIFPWVPRKNCNSVSLVLKKFKAEKLTLIFGIILYTDLGTFEKRTKKIPIVNRYMIG